MSKTKVAKKVAQIVAKEAGKKIISIAASKVVPGYGAYKSVKKAQKVAKILYKGIKTIF